MTEKGVGKQLIIQACHIDGNKDALIPAQAMNRIGDQLFSHSGFPGDQYGFACPGDGFTILKN